MKFLVAFLLTALLAFIFGLYFPWWSIAIAAFIVALLVRLSSWKAFLAGFLGVFLLWTILSWWIDQANESILSTKIGVLLGIGANPVALILITGLIGGLVGGLSSLTASFLRAAEK